MKVITAGAMRDAERLAIGEFGIAGLSLMETAGRNCAALILAGYGRYKKAKAIVIAGKGNNGGDGYVVARCLREQGWEVKIFVIARCNEISGDAAVNLALLDEATVFFCPDCGGMLPYAYELADADVIVDALFGIGLRSEVRGPYAEAVELINASGTPVVAVDIASGIDATTGTVLGVAAKACLTVTFAFAKMGHILYPGAEYCGRLEVVDIGLPDEVLAGTGGFEFLDAETVRLLLRKRERNAHKGSFGHCLILAGSTGKTGAAALSANSAVRTGSGLVTLAVPASLNAILEVKTTEAMTLPLEDAGCGWLGGHLFDDIVKASSGKSVLALGPGISRQPETAALIRRLVTEIPLPMVIDADGLNALSEDVSVLLRKRSDNVILTPHPGEMSRLCGLPIDGIEADRIAAARDFAVKYNVYLILKGARTIISTPEGTIAINGSGNPGMASGGMGDVLTGILASLLGQGYPAAQACRIGVFLHGYAADLLVDDKGEIGITAGDVQERLPWAVKKLMEK
jgi:ADP-dependent NAD(P)H-hydrate dehydratase / NAD(P)H-hydrate epimerase